MSDTIKAGTILIKEGTLLPEAVRFESECTVPGWRLVKDLDRCGLDREIREAGWNFFWLAGEIRVRPRTGTQECKDVEDEGSGTNSRNDRGEQDPFGCDIESA